MSHWLYKDSGLEGVVNTFTFLISKSLHKMAKIVGYNLSFPILMCSRLSIFVTFLYINVFGGQYYVAYLSFHSTMACT